MPETTPASKAFLLGVVALGVLSTILAFTFINSSSGADSGPPITIVEARHDLRPNVALDPDRDLKIEKIPSSFRSLKDRSLLADRLADYKGQRLNRPIAAGDPIFLADLSAVGSLDIRPGYVALTIAADPGIIIPGDYVKVVVAQPKPAAQPNTPANSANYLCGGQAFKVLAVGNALFKNRQAVTVAEQYDSGSTAKNVTLEVTEPQVLDFKSALPNDQQKATLVLCPPPNAPDATRP